MRKTLTLLIGALLACSNATAQLNLTQETNKPKQEKLAKPQKPKQELEPKVGTNDTTAVATLIAGNGIKCSRLSSNAWIATKVMAHGLQWDKAELLFDADGVLLRVDYEPSCFDINSATETLQAVDRGLSRQFGRTRRLADAISANDGRIMARAAAFATNDDTYTLVLSYSLVQEQRPEGR